MADIISKDMGFDAFIKMMNETSDCEIQAGYFEDSGEENGMTLARLMAIHEFGTDTIPERPVLRLSSEKYNDKWLADVEKGFARLIESKGKLKALDILRVAGEKMVGDIQKEFGSSELEPKKVVHNGHDKPLIDTGHLRASVSSRVILK